MLKRSFIFTNSFLLLFLLSSCAREDEVYRCKSDKDQFEYRLTEDKKTIDKYRINSNEWIEDTITINQDFLSYKLENDNQLYINVENFLEENYCHN